MTRSFRWVWLLLLALSAGGLFWTPLGCSDSNQSLTLEGNLLRYPETELVSFALSGNAACNLCKESDRFMGLQVELSIKGDPLHALAFGSFDGLGHFAFGDLQAPAGTVIEVRGMLFREDAPPSAAVRGYAEVSVPDDDGAVVAVTLNFPSSASSSAPEEE